MAQMQRTPRPAATTLRSKFFGPANQVSYEVDSKIQRDNMKAKLKRDHDAAYAKGRKAASKASTTGMNAGTMGGSRGALLSTFLNR
jgi:hypothetical protein